MSVGEKQPRLKLGEQFGRKRMPEKGAASTVIETRLPPQETTETLSTRRTHLAVPLSQTQLHMQSAGVEESGKKKRKHFGEWIVEKISKHIVEPIAQARLNSAFNNPQENQKRINYYAFRIIKEASQPLWVSKATNFKQAVHLALFPGADHAYIPIPWLFIKSSLIPVTHFWPIFVSTLVNAFGYNLVNFVQAASEKRFKRAAWYLFSTVACATHLPYLFTSFYSELVGRALDRKILQEAQRRYLEILDNPETNEPKKYQAAMRAIKKETKHKSVLEWRMQLDKRDVETQRDIMLQQEKEIKQNKAATESTNWFGKTYHKVLSRYHKYMQDNDYDRLTAVSTTRRFLDTIEEYSTYGSSL